MHWFKTEGTSELTAHTLRLDAREHLILAETSLRQANAILAKEDTSDNQRQRHLNDLMIRRIEGITA